mmetsp:Transcript_135365/g.191539  ORF Transcript_135365/g.191539 Transcript_135365/m.191539 type:complete len:121 (+) Transcript_135365:49-411(+)
MAFFGGAPTYTAGPAFGGFAPTVMAPTATVQGGPMGYDPSAIRAQQNATFHQHASVPQVHSYSPAGNPKQLQALNQPRTRRALPYPQWNKPPFYTAETQIKNDLAPVLPALGPYANTLFA